MIHPEAMHDFTPISALVGGAAIALSLGLLLITTGHVVGLSRVLSAS